MANNYKNAAVLKNNRTTFHHDVRHNRGGQLIPMHIDAVREGESGVYTCQAEYELAEMPIRLVNNITAGIVSVAVPVPAITWQAFGDADDMAGTDEWVRRKLTASTSLFGLASGETEIVEAARLMPRSVSGALKVNAAVSYGHAAAINFLRQRKYVDIDTVPLGSGLDDITPCLFSDSVLDRLGGVLDPDKRINGQADLTGQIPVVGTATVGDLYTGVDYTNNAWDGDGNVENGSSDWSYVIAARNGSSVTSGLDPAMLPPVDLSGAYADLAGSDGLSLSDLYQAEKREDFARIYRKLIDDNPQYGEEIALRYAAGLSVNVGAQPFVIYEKEEDFGAVYQQGVESTGIYDGGMKGLHRFNFQVPVPRTEFGMLIFTFVYVKPDETIANQPHPILTDEWTSQDFHAEELAINPEKVVAADVDATVDSADEENIVFYAGHNALKRKYSTYGWSLDTDLNMVEEKSSTWQIDVPLSLDPENMIYPETVDHYPFADQNGHAFTAFVRAGLNLKTPMVFGPKPVENVGVIDDEDLLEVE